MGNPFDGAGAPDDVRDAELRPPLEDVPPEILGLHLPVDTAFRPKYIYVSHMYGGRYARFVGYSTSDALEEVPGALSTADSSVSPGALDLGTEVSDTARRYYIAVVVFIGFDLTSGHTGPNATGCRGVRVWRPLRGGATGGYTCRTYIDTSGARLAAHYDVLADAVRRALDHALEHARNEGGTPTLPGCSSEEKRRVAIEPHITAATSTITIEAEQPIAVPWEWSGGLTATP